MSILPIFVFSLVFAGSTEAAWWSFGRSNNTKDQIKSENSEFNQGKRDNRGTGMQRNLAKGNKGNLAKGNKGNLAKGNKRPLSPRLFPAEAIACMKTAVEARETSIISATSASILASQPLLMQEKPLWSTLGASPARQRLKQHSSLPVAVLSQAKKLPQKLLNPPIKRL